MFRLLARSDRVTASGPLTWKIWTSMIAVPLLVMSLLAWAFWSPTGNHGTAKAAVVNNDQPVTVDGQMVPLGRQLAGDLVHSHTSAYDWVLTDPADARSGLADGTYAAVVTIPPAFSKEATSAVTANPLDARQAALSIETSGNAGLVDPLASRDVANATLAALRQQVVRTYLGNIYIALTSIHNQIGKAADAAAQLASAMDQLYQGITTLDHGSGRLADGLGQLADGANKLAGGANRLAAGTGQLARGSARLASGTAQLRQQTAGLPRQTRALATGAQKVANGNRRLANAVVPIANAIIAIIDALPSAKTAAKRFRQFAAQCEANGGNPLFCGQLIQAAKQFSRAAAAIDHAKNTIRRKAVQLRNDVQRLATGSQQVANGAARLAAAAPQLTAGIASAASGAQRVNAGAQNVNSGARQLDSGARSLATGTTQASGGAERLADGANLAAAGAARLDGATHSLVAGLARGRDQVPSYTPAERENLARVAADPLASHVFGPSGFGVAAAAFFLVLALWAGALVTYLVIRAVPPDVLTSREPTWRIIVTATAPGAIVAALIALVLSLALAPWLNVSAGRWLAFLLAALVAAVAFAAVNQALAAIFKRAGRIASVAVLVLTVAAGVISSVPRPFTLMLPFLPTHGAILALRALVTGSPGTLAGVLELVVWLSLGVAATIMVTERRRRVTGRDLRYDMPTAERCPAIR